MPVGAGEMRHRLNLYAPEGTYAVSAATIAENLPAKIAVLPLPFQQAERLAAGGLRGQVSYHVFTPYRSDLRQDYQLIETCCSQRTFNIVTMIHDDKMTTWELTCVVG